MLIKPEISIVITVYNKAKYIESVINSYLTQFDSDALELILVDDNSSDDSVQIIEKMLKKYNNIKLIKNSENRGPSVRLNQGLKQASGSYIMFADGDDVILPNTIKRLIELMKKNNADYLKAPYGGRIFDINKFDVVDLNEFTGYLDVEIVENPLSYVIQKRVIGMGGLIIKNQFGTDFKGCDESIFVQDISIHLELGKYAKKLLLLSESFLFGFEDNKNSLTRSMPVQAHYDLILSYKNFYEQNINYLHKDDVSRMVKKSVSVMWKSQKRGHRLGIKLYFHYYWLYLRGKCNLYQDPESFMQILLDSFDDFIYIRKNKTVS